MAPEQAAGESAVDARGDVYSLGAVALFALPGRPPFQGKMPRQVIAAHRTEPAPPLDLCAQSRPTSRAVVARCLAKDPTIVSRRSATWTGPWRSAGAPPTGRPTSPRVMRPRPPGT